MRRLDLTVLATVSFAALLGFASPAQSVQSSVQILGVLKQKDQWQVGSVGAKDAPYCAMVGHFDQASVLAFARSAEGFGSLAIEFKDDLFKPSKKYEISLTVDGQEPRLFSGEATGKRSLVVQIGEDATLYNAFNRNGKLRVTTSAIDVSFSLAKFSNHYRNLQTCATALSGPILVDGPAVASAPVTGVDKSPLEPIKGLFGKITSAVTQKRSVAGDVIPLTPEAEAAVGTKLAQSDDLDKKKITSTDEPAEKPAERKLLASLKASPAIATPLEGGLTAQQMEAHQTTRLKAAVAVKEKEIIALEAKKLAAAEKQKAEAALKEKQLAAQTAALQKEQAALAAAAAESVYSAKDVVWTDAPVMVSAADATEKPVKKPVQMKVGDDVKAMKAQQALAAKQTEMAALEAERVAAAEMQLRETQKAENAFSADMLALQQERDQLKQQLAQALAVNKTADPQAAAKVKASQEKLSVMETELAATDSARRDLAARLAVLEEQNKALKDTLDGKAQKQASAQNDVLLALKTELATAEKESSALQLALADEKAKVSATGMADKKLADQYAALSKELNAKQSDIQSLETRMAELETSRAAEAKRAADLEQSRLAEVKRAAELEEARVAEAQRVAELEKLRAAETARLAALEKARTEESARLAALQVERDAARAEVEALKNTLAQEKNKPAQVVKAAPAVPVTKLAASEWALVDAEDEIQRLSLEKMQLQQQLQQQQQQREKMAQAPVQPLRRDSTVAQRNVERSLADVSPASGAAVEVFDAPIVASQPAAMPAVPAAPVARQNVMVASSGNGAAASNRAERFLDDIMQYHRPAGTPAPKKSLPAQPAARPVAQPVKPYQPAAPAAAVAAPVLTPVVTSSPASQAVAHRPLSLEALLDQSGLRGAAFQPAEVQGSDVVRQWSVGRVSGLYEQTPSAGRSMDTLVQDYVSRYKTDCPNDLKVTLGRGEMTPAGMVSAGALSCTMSGNSYETAIVFQRNDANFTAILHSGNASDAAQVKSIGDNLVYALSSSGGVLPVATARAPQPNRRTVTQEPSVQAPQHMRFNIAPTPDAQNNADTLPDTVVIQ